MQYPKFKNMLLISLLSFSLGAVAQDQDNDDWDQFLLSKIFSFFDPFFD